MSYFTWTPQMTVGLARLDEDHKSLIAIINQLADALEGNSGAGAVDQIFLSLIRYAEIHFTREEEVLRAINYQEMEGHRNEHEVFISDILDMRAGYRNAKPTVRRDLLRYLKSWLKNHIMVEDMAYKPFVEDNPTARNAAECFAALEIKTSR